MGFKKVWIGFNQPSAVRRMGPAWNPDPPPGANGRRDTTGDGGGSMLGSGRRWLPEPPSPSAAAPCEFTWLSWTQNRKLKCILELFSCFARLSAKVGPKNLPKGPGLKNAT